MRLLILPALLLSLVCCQAQHPITFFSKAEADEVKKQLFKYPVLSASYNELKNEVDVWLGKDIDVPVPKDPAGGYTHDKHKSNYMLMFNSGILFNLTADKRYAELVKNILLKYAKLNPTLKKHVQATSSSPGRIFWQALNDANWLVYTGIAYDLVYNHLTAAERNTITAGAFKPEVDYLTKDLESWFNLIHNHGVWACAGVGIVGLATDNKDYVEMALYGTKKDRKSGFIAQLNGLFSPDGYYTEGPYYVRYALLPYYMFANALNNAQPSLKIFEQRNQVLRKALEAALQQTNINGRFYAFNDAIKEKDYTTSEMVTAMSIAYKVYGNNKSFLPVARNQNRVLLTKGGLSIAAALQTNNSLKYFPYKTVEYTDGADGKQGGISILRNGSDANLSSLIFKYTSHGLSHGHYDKLNINLFDKGNEILQDYGAVRFVGVEQKFGGRYLPESKNYAEQTIAHNTVVVDEKSHFDGKEEIAEKYHSEKLFSDTSSKQVQVVAAKDEHAYKDVKMQRSVYMLELPANRKMLIDIFNVTSANDHQYDLPFQYNGQVIKTSFAYKPFTDNLQSLGNKNGYQYLWKEAQAAVSDTLLQFTFLNDNTYYTITSQLSGSAETFLTRTGANDPNFNLRREPSYIIRKRGKNQSFVNVIEMHGNFDPVLEFSSSSYPSVQEIKLLENNNSYTIAEVVIAGKLLVVAQANADFARQSKHSFNKDGRNLNWSGPFKIWYDGKTLGEHN